MPLQKEAKLLVDPFVLYMASMMRVMRSRRVPSRSTKMMSQGSAKEGRYSQVSKAAMTSSAAIDPTISVK
jgi:hypothetical protein